MGELVDLIRRRIGSEFDGECHLSEAEAVTIASEIERLQRELARFRSDRSYIVGWNDGWDEARRQEDALAQLNAIVDAWEALPGGRQVRNRDVEYWLANDMAPAINTIRDFLRRPKPDVGGE